MGKKMVTEPRDEEEVEVLSSSQVSDPKNSHFSFSPSFSLGL
jgi:hypothetical protein